MVSSISGSGRKKIHDQEYYMDGYLCDNFTLAKEMVKDDWDMIGCYDGYEGSGKSVKAMQDAYFFDSTFTLDRVCFTGELFKRAIEKAEPQQAVVYDEAFTGLSSRESMNKINKNIIKMLAEIRQKNLFVLIVLPTFFDLDRNVALWRTRYLVHIYINKKRVRGFFSFFNADKKKVLYAAGRKYYSYRHPNPNFRGRFTNHYVVNEKKYRARKFEALLSQFRPEKIVRSEKQMEEGFKNKLIARLAHLDGLSIKQKAAVLGVAPKTWQGYIAAYRKKVIEMSSTKKSGESSSEGGV